jgi:hypothetical protein
MVTIPLMNTVFIYGHTGLGDMIAVNGAVRYLASKFKKVNFVCLDIYIDHGEFMFKDLENVYMIKLIDGCKTIRDFGKEGLLKNSLVLNYGGLYLKSYDQPGFLKLDMYETMIFCSNPIPPDAIYPDYFYEQMGLPAFLRLEKFKVDTEQGPDAPDIPYRFIHRQSTKSTNSMHFDDDMLVLDPNENYYQADDPKYDQAKVALDLPTIFHRIKLIQGAKELHLVESSYLMLCLHLDLSHIPVKMYYNKRTPLNSGEFKLSESNK